MFQQQTFLNNPGERGNTDCVSCPSSDKNRYKIFIDVFCWAHLQNIMYNLGHTEFSAYLLGTRSEDGCEFKIDDYYIFRQKVTSVISEAKEDLLEIPKEIRQRILIHLHSHHFMGVGHSGVDYAHFNYPVHIIIGVQGQYKATIRVKTDCGRWMQITDVPITFVGKESELVKEEMKKIEKIEQEHYVSKDNDEEQTECYWCGVDFELFGRSPIRSDGNLFCSHECLSEYQKHLDEAFPGPMSSDDDDDSPEQKQPLIAGNWEIKTGMVF